MNCCQFKITKFYSMTSRPRNDKLYSFDHSQNWGKLRTFTRKIEFGTTFYAIVVWISEIFNYDNHIKTHEKCSSLLRRLLSINIVGNVFRSLSLMEAMILRSLLVRMSIYILRPHNIDSGSNNDAESETQLICRILCNVEVENCPVQKWNKRCERMREEGGGGIKEEVENQNTKARRPPMCKARRANKKH